MHRLPASTLLALPAAAAPALLAYNVAPSATLLNQLLALALWGVFVAVTRAAPVAPPAGGVTGAAGVAGAGEASTGPGAAAWPLLAALGGMAAGVLGSWGPGTLPATLALSALGLLAAAGVMVVHGAATRGAPAAPDRFAAFTTGWLVAGALSAAIAAVQVFLPEWADGTWIARATEPGRAAGNLRQPNHLSSLLNWAALAAVVLGTLGRLRWRAAAALFAPMVVAIVWTASRTGAFGLLLLAAWGALDRGLPRPARRLLLGAPLIYALAWAAMAAWSHASGAAFAAEARLAAADVSSSRFAIWRDTLALIAAQPWAGVGFGEFNLAWTLTPSPHRPTAFFDHAHNLPLHLLAELGVPLGAAVLALLGWAGWRGWRRSAGDPAARAAWMFVAVIGWHSLLEYPLWYAHFLLPAAWAWGFALGRPAAGDGRDRDPDTGATPGAVRRAPAGAPVPSHARGGRAVALGGAAMVLAAAFTVVDYGRVVRIFEPGTSRLPLAARIADGRGSWLFGHHADYAAATSGVPQPDGLQVFERPAHFLLDTRLMVAWTQALDAAGEKDKARHLAARLREFGPQRAPAIFEGCEAGPFDPATTAIVPPGIGCVAPAREIDWRAFVRR